MYLIAGYVRLYVSLGLHANYSSLFITIISPAMGLGSIIFYHTHTHVDTQTHTDTHTDTVLGAESRNAPWAR